MFGVLRTLLALLVMIGHLTDHWQIGTYAVFAFYIISGYLMTLIMQESYGFERRGRLAFVINRVLRLYPLYWCALLISIAAVALVGSEVARLYHPAMQLPGTLGEWLSVGSMLYIGLFPNEVTPNLAPTTWAITVELFFYAAICLGLSRNKSRVVLWLAVSIVYTIACLALDLGWRYRYFPIMAASLPFSIGAMLYFLKRQGYPPLDDGVLFKPITLLVLLVVNCTGVVAYDYYFELGFYVSLFLSILLCYQLAMGETWGKVSERLDKSIGDYSYPMYLLHWQVGLIVSFLLFGKPVHDTSTNGLLSLGMSLLVIGVITWLFLRWVDRPIQGWRRQIKRRNAEHKNAINHSVDS